MSNKLFQTIFSTSTFIWAGYLVLHTILAGNWYVWLYTSVIPPIFFLVISTIIGICIVIFITTHFKKIHILYFINIIIFLTIVIPLTLGLSDFNFNVLKSKNDAQVDFTVFNWNSEFWESSEQGRIATYEFLQQQNADIYHIQEHVDPYFVPYNDIVELQKYFPDYEIFKSGEFVTISKFPVLTYHIDETGFFTHSQIIVNNEIISFYNVHVPVQFFSSNLKERFELRQNVIRQLNNIIAHDKNPYIISGDFNTTTSMKDINSIRSRNEDAFEASNKLLPGTWELLNLSLWRIDWIFYSSNLQSLTYKDFDTQLSDHHGQKVEFALI